MSPFNRRRAILALLAPLAWACTQSDPASPGGTGAHPPFRGWTYAGHSFQYGGGIAFRARDAGGRPEPGLTVFLADGPFTCDSLPFARRRFGGSISADYPDFSLGDGAIRGDFAYIPDGPGPSGGGSFKGSGGLAAIDTAGARRVEGWFDLADPSTDPEFPGGQASGSFSVPYCPGGDAP